jgi:hypothetical protein
MWSFVGKKIPSHCRQCQIHLQATLYNLSFLRHHIGVLTAFSNPTHTDKIMFTLLLSLYRNKKGKQVTPTAQKKGAVNERQSCHWRRMWSRQKCTNGELAAHVLVFTRCVSFWKCGELIEYRSTASTFYIPPARPHTPPVRFSYYTLRRCVFPCDSLYSL